MTEAFYTPAALGEILGVDEATVLEYRRNYGWPSFKAGKTIRFSPRDVEQIVAKHSKATAKPDAPAEPVAIPGQTSRSARRSA